MNSKTCKVCILAIINLKALIFALFINFLFSFSGIAQLPPVFNTGKNSVRTSELERIYLTPTRIVWTSDNQLNTQVINAVSLLNKGNGQANLNRGNDFVLKNDGAKQAGVILDFGKEIQGGIQIITTGYNKKGERKVRVRFGESVAEAMSEISATGATNDHAMRDFEIQLPWLGGIEVGNSGFRFVRIDLLSPAEQIEIKEINAIFSFRNIPYLGSFRSNDLRLNDIWMTGAYTVHLNMQDFLWDGIKRDRLVWVGDLHPEVMTINSVFGYNKVVPRSLDLARDLTPFPGWMNGISSYSMWWVLIHRDWFYYQGDLNYLKEQKEYLSALLKQLISKIDDNGKEMLDGGRFLDWPSSKNLPAIHAGLQALMLKTFEAGVELCTILDDFYTASQCQEAIQKLKHHIPESTDSKQATALLSLSGLMDPVKANGVLSNSGVKNMSTFYGYYILKAKAKAGDYQGAINAIREYWGAMLDLGSTTFWEDFDIEWMDNAARIDEVVPENKIDVHGSFGDYCYKSYRHSLCHGWASGPTAWLTEYVLGIKVIEPGCKTIKIEPHLGDLNWVEGSFPTPYGSLEVKHIRTIDGKIHTTFKAPKEVKIEYSRNVSFKKMKRKNEKNN